MKSSELQRRRRERSHKEILKEAVRVRIERERRILAILILQAARTQQPAVRNAAPLTTRKRRCRELKAREEKNGALGDGNHEDDLCNRFLDRYKSICFVL